jgi:hypothetical protein
MSDINHVDTGTNNVNGTSFLSSIPRGNHLRYPISRNNPTGEGIVQIALEVCEEKLRETRRRNLQTQSYKVGAQQDTQKEGEADDNDNPFLTKLGSPFMNSRSILGQSKPQHPSPSLRQISAIDNTHPWMASFTEYYSQWTKSSKIRPREGQSISQISSQDYISQHNKLSRPYERISSILDTPSYSVLVLLLAIILVPRGLRAFEKRIVSWNMVQDRRLQGRHCVMNLFLHKFQEDEFNPDYKQQQKLRTLSSKEAKQVENSISLPDTYRTRGQMDIITRLISCVADSFRTRLHIIQHVVFTGTRDGGHLAQEAIRFWPARGNHRTRLHIFADGDHHSQSPDGLKYNNVANIEKRFPSFHKYINIYDSQGNLAGITQDKSDEEDDDYASFLSENEKTIPERNLVNGTFNDILWSGDEDEDMEDESDQSSVIPYFHIDGTSMASQLAILDKARGLLERRIVSVVGFEHSPDLDIPTIIEFFRSVQYKTFIVGLRQLSRLDNLCPEILENLLSHPNLSSKKSRFGFLPLSSSSSSSTQNQQQSPPYFVAMPSGRHHSEETTIQHMYDLFSGQGGGGQVKTANDRKALVKKKK